MTTLTHPRRPAPRPARVPPLSARRLRRLLPRLAGLLLAALLLRLSALG